MGLFSRHSILTRSLLFKKLNASPCWSNNLHLQSSLRSVKQAPTTVDAADVKHHANIVRIWWDLNGKLKGLHSLNLIRVPFVRDGLVQCSPDERTATPLTGKTILDVGCGGGIFSEGLAKLGAHVTGLDAGKEVIEVAREHCKSNPNLENNRPLYICSSIEEHAENHKDHYDAVVASEIIEHVNDKELFVKSCVETLKPGGRIFFTTPTRTRLAQLLGIFLMEYIVHFIPRGTHQYEKFTTPNELTLLLERNNCHVEIIHGTTYNLFKNRWRFIDTQVLMFALQAVKLK